MKKYTGIIVLCVIAVAASIFIISKFFDFNSILLSLGVYDKKITVVNTADIHGHIVYDDEVGGYYSMDDVSIIMGMPLVKHFADEARKNNQNTLFLDTGDLFHGTNEANIDKGKGVVEIANMMGYDAMVPGNHDFNFGFDRLIEIQKELKFPMLSANVYKNGKLVFDEYKIVKIGGVKIGLFGLTTPEAVEFANLKGTEGLHIDTDYVKPAKNVVEKLKGKVDMIILLSHLGSSCDTEIAEKVDGIQLILCGHGHELFTSAKKVRDTYLVSSGAWTTHVGIADAYFKDGKMKALSWNLKTTNDESLADKQLASSAEVYHKIALKDSKVIVGKADVKLNGIRHYLRTRETNLGDLLADSMREAGNADIALMNGGGIRESIPQGEINLYKMGEILPFSNSLVTIELSGNNIYRAIERGLRVYPSSNYGAFLQVSGISYVFDGSKMAGERLVSVTKDNKPLDRNKLYRVATNDYIFNGGDGYEEIKGAKLLNRGALLKDILIQYIKNRGVIAPKEDGRIKVINERYKDD